MRIIFGLMAVVLLLGCSSPQVQIENETQDLTKPTILVAVLNDSYSWYKKDLVSMVKQDFGLKYNVEVVAVKNPKDLEGKSFEALIVMDMLRAWLLFNGGLKKFAALPDQSKIVYFVSTGDANWKWKNTKVSALTGATQNRKASEKYPKLKAKLDYILK